MEQDSSPGLESSIRLWPVAEALSTCLPVGDLITLSRSSAALRAGLHGFPEPHEDVSTGTQDGPRISLNIGQHNTPSWKRLKELAPFECSSPKHAKRNLSPKPCRYCSRPICDACIVQSSFSRGRENTFQNRVRYLCKGCWDDGNHSKSRRFPLDPTKDISSRTHWFDPGGSTRECCTCTLKVDGTICLECKDRQNWAAISSAETQCHGLDCANQLEEDKDRRRICLWCNKALPRQIGGTTRYHWNQKMIDARARNAASRQADLEEYNRKRFKSMTMSRREMRGSEAVKDDADADLPQFVRNFDTINYRAYMRADEVPSGEAVYHSKRGHWTYSQKFLLALGRRCRDLPLPSLDTDAACLKANATSTFARTNIEKYNEFAQFTSNSSMPSMSERRCKAWHELKATILWLSVDQGMDPQQIQEIIRADYGFHATVLGYKKMVQLWNAEDSRKKYEEAQQQGSMYRVSTTESTKSRSSLRLKGKLAAFGFGRFLTPKWEILTSESDNEDDEEAVDSSSSSESSSPRERDMWADYHDERRVSLENGEAVDDPEPASYASDLAEEQTATTTSQHRPRSHMPQRNATQTDADLIDQLAPAEGNETAHVDIAGATDPTTTSPTHSDSPPPYSPDGWAWPSAPPLA